MTRVAPGLTVPDSVRLKRLLGRPILLVFYNPTSRTAEELLKFAQSVQDADKSQVTVVGLAVTDDGEGALKQYTDLKLNFLLLSGKGLKQTYAVEATPKLVVLDPAGVVRGALVGWGREIPHVIVDEIKRWQRVPLPVPR